MTFSLEALRARHGDSLLLHFGTQENPSLVLIDGGPGAVYGDALKPRLLELRERFRALGKLRDDESLPLKLLMVSHIDDDHIGGLLQLTSELIAEDQGPRAPWLRPQALWHNSFDDLAGDAKGPEEVTASPQEAKDAEAVIASVGQGQQLRSDAETLHWPLNDPFGGLVEAPAAGGQTVELDDHTSLHVVAPRTDQIEGLRKEWAEQVAKMRKKKESDATIAEYLDKSPYNLSSIVCLARQVDRVMLLTGDARGDHVLDSLEAAGVTNGGTFHVDILKLPHHGSIRNVEEDFFEKVTADHYVISANGRHGNPESETLEMIAATRDDDDFTIHLTYGTGDEDLEGRLDEFVKRHRKRDFQVATRPDDDLSLTIDLDDPAPH